jgi:hypothetical protein
LECRSGSVRTGLFMVISPFVEERHSELAGALIDRCRPRLLASNTFSRVALPLDWRGKIISFSNVCDERCADEHIAWVGETPAVETTYPAVFGHRVEAPGVGAVLFVIEPGFDGPRHSQLRRTFVDRCGMHLLVPNTVEEPCDAC